MATLTARQIYADDRQIVIIVESSNVRCDKSDATFRLMATSQPVAVVIDDESGSRAVDVSGEQLDLDQLLVDATALGKLLAQGGHSGSGES